jgi:hypothetical protein
MQRKTLACLSAGSLAILTIFTVLAAPIATAATIEAYRYRGTGLAIEEPDGNLHKSKLGFIAVIESKEGASIHFNVRKGLLTINEQGKPVNYTMIAETWHGTVQGDGKSFKAEGKVTDATGNTYTVTLKGEPIRQTPKGIFINIQGNLTGKGENYILIYLALLNHIVREIPVQQT